MEQRERMVQLSPAISPSIPSYASVATRNTNQTITIRSIQDFHTDFVVKTESSKTVQGSKPQESDKSNHMDHTNRRSSASSAFTRGSQTDHERRRERPASFSTRRTRDSQNVNDWKNNKRNSRDKSQNRKDNFDRASSSSREKERTQSSSPKHKVHSPRRSPPSSVTESCGMRSNKGVKSMGKYVRSKKRKAKRKKLCLDGLL